MPDNAPLLTASGAPASPRGAAATSAAVAAASSSTPPPPPPASASGADSGGDSLKTSTHHHHHPDHCGDGGSSPTFTLNEAMDAVGFGPFQWAVLILCGLVWAADSMELMLLSFLLPAARGEWPELSPAEEASIGSFSFAGAAIGAYLFGAIADRFGRRFSIMLSLVLTGLFGFASGFSPTPGVLMVARMIVGLGLGGAPVAFALFAEFLPTKGRGVPLVLIEIMWTVGTVGEAALAWAILPTAGWRVLLMVTAGPALLLVITAWFLPESPRYLLAQESQASSDQAAKLVTRVARVNRKELPPGDLHDPLAGCESDDEDSGGGGGGADAHGEDAMKLKGAGASSFASKQPWYVRGMHSVRKARVWGLFSTEFRRTTLLLWILWFVNNLVYYGIVLFTPLFFERRFGTATPPDDAPPSVTPGPNSTNTTNTTLFFDAVATDDVSGAGGGAVLAAVQPLGAGGGDGLEGNRDVFLDTFITSTAELPGLLVSAFLIDRIGRKATLAVLFAICGLSIGGLIAPFYDDQNIALGFAFAARGAIMGSFASVYVYTPEVYPTAIRTTGLGAAGMIAKTASIITPYISNLLIEVHLYVPIAIYGTSCVLAAIAAMFLPIETGSRPLDSQAAPSRSQHAKEHYQQHAYHGGGKGTDDEDDDREDLLGGNVALDDDDDDDRLR